MAGLFRRFLRVSATLACAAVLTGQLIGGGAVPVAIAIASAAPMPAAPPTQFAICKSCHSINKGGGALIGPNLFGIVGAPAASRPGYAYSDGMKKAKIRWTRDSIDAFLANPRALVPGTKMILVGVKPADRAVIISYLETLK